jgi:hypothetical protein
MAMKTTEIIGLVVAAILLGVLLPIALNDLLGFYSTNDTVMTLVATVLPVIAVIAIILMFVPKRG